MSEYIVNMKCPVNEWLELEVDTTIPNATPSDTIKLKIEEGNFDIDWGDGTPIENLTISVTTDPRLTHVYSVGGIYTIRLRGGARISWSNSSVNYDLLKITKLKNWGEFGNFSLNDTFNGALNMVITATDYLKSAGTTAVKTFQRCTSLVVAPKINPIYVTTYTNMFRLSAFDDDIGYWNVSNMTGATDMFRDTSMSTANCDALLIGWTRWANGQSNITLKSNVQLHLGTTSYTIGGDAEDAFNYLVGTLGWVITII